MQKRVVAELLSLLAAGGFLFVDLQGIKLGGQTVQWQIPALLSLVLFAALVYWHMFSLNQQIHSPENQIDVTIRPDPLFIDSVPKWHALSSFTDIPKTHTTHTYLFLDIVSADVNPRTVNKVYVEVWSARYLLRKQWVLPFPFQKRALRVSPVRIDSDINWHKREFPEQVDWAIPAGGGMVTHRISFERQWDESRDNLPAPPKQYQLFLVAEIGGRQHKRRWDVLKEAIS